MKTLLTTGLTMALLVVSMIHPARAEIRLVMIEEEGCIYCTRWRQEVGPEYALTPEGLAAPLLVIDIRSETIAEYDLTSRPRLTPTFILVENKLELSRLEGYPGEDFFWGLLGRMLENANIDLNEPSH